MHAVIRGSIDAHHQSSIDFVLEPQRPCPTHSAIAQALTIGIAPFALHITTSFARQCRGLSSTTVARRRRDRPSTSV